MMRYKLIVETTTYKIYHSEGDALHFFTKTKDALGNEYLSQVYFNQANPLIRELLVQSAMWK